MKELIKKVNDNQKMLIEMIAMSFVTGWFVTNLVYNTSKEVENINYLADFSFAGFIIVILLSAMAAGVVYFMNRELAGVLMFLAVFAYCLRTADEYTENIYLAITLVIISGIALTYVRNDIISILSKIKLDEKWGIGIAVAMTVWLIIFIGVITVYRYETYSNSTFDFGIFAQMFENMKNTGKPVTSVERADLGSFSHFGVHCSPIFYLMLPFYWLFPSPVTVQMIQAVTLGVAVVPLYFLARHYNLTVKVSLILCATYCVFPAIASGTCYDFHENCCVPLFLFLFILMMEKKKDLWAAISGLLLLMVKEDAALYILVIGVYFIISKRDKKRGIIVSVVSLIYFACALMFIRSHGNGDLASTHFGNVMYDKDNGIAQIVFTLLANPAYVMTQMITEEKIKYVILMILPMGMGLIQNKKYSRYILLGTFVVFNLMPSYQYRADIGFQYNFGAVALFMYIAIMTASEWKQKRMANWALTSFVITLVLFVNFTYQKWDIYVDRYESKKEVCEQMDSALSIVPYDASVLTSGFIMPHLYYVDDLTVIRGEYEVNQDYIVIDLREGYSQDMEALAPNLGDYTLIYEVPEALRIYAKQ